MQVQSLVKELKSHMLGSMARGKKKKNYLVHNVNTVKVEKVTFIEC